MRSSHHLVIGIALFAVAGAACGKGAPNPGASPPGRPTGAGDIVVQVVVDGGFVRPETALGTVPVTTVLGDGTVITTAPTLAIYPGPALAPLQSAKVDTATVDRLVRRARELGLLAGPLDFGQPQVADAPNTTVTIVAGGESHRHVANALEIDVAGAGAAPRRALRDFVAALAALPPGNRPWEPTAVAARVAGRYQPDAQLPQAAVAWPLTRTPVASGAAGVPCLVVDGADLAVLRAALAKANALTPWVIDGVARSVVFVPVVPGTTPCPA
jgi:hypothetical protein